MAGVKAARVDDIDAERRAPGSFGYFSAADRPIAGLIYVCPCGCGKMGSLDFRPHPSPSWQWDGNYEAPTLTPSVNHMIAGKTHWHGWLKAGVWTSC